MGTENSSIRSTVNQVLHEHHVLEGRMLYNSDVWREIFVKVFGENPTSNDDPRWDTLLNSKEGYSALKIASEYK